MHVEGWKLGWILFAAVGNWVGKFLLSRFQENTMSVSKRIKTAYPGIYYRETRRIGGSGVERVYYAVYKRDGKVIETKVGRQYADDMTPSRASLVRAQLVEGKRSTRKEARLETQRKEAMSIWTIETLWEEYKRRRPDLKGLKTDQNRFEVHLCHLQKMRPEDIDTTVIDNLRLLLTQSGKKPGTIRNVLELLRRIISFGVKKGLITSAQVTAQFEMPLLNNEKTEDLTPRQLQALLAAITETKYKKAGDMMLLALYTGMRRGEMFNLQWEHIDWNRGFINLVGQDDGFGAKSGQSERIPLNDLARQLLSAIPHGKSPFVFPGKFGGRLVDIRKQADALKKEAGLPEDFRPFHGLRHVYASMVASTGKVSMYELQKLLTHKSSAMTQRYAHLRDDALKRASQAAGEALAQALDGSQDRCSR